VVFESWYSPARSRDGTVDGVIGVGSDITERRRAEEALRRSEESHRALVQHASHAIYRSSPDGRGGIWTRCARPRASGWCSRTS
jgi:PAS domain-containing protein